MQNNLQLLHNNNYTKTHLVEVLSEVYPTLPLVQDVENENKWYLDGISEQTVAVQGKNLIDESKETESKYLGVEGSLNDSSLSDVTGFIEVMPNTYYFFNWNKRW